jgi:hypothetical protein
MVTSHFLSNDLRNGGRARERYLLSKLTMRRVASRFAFRSGIGWGFGGDSFVRAAALLYPACRFLHLEAPMTQSLTPLESLLFNIVLGTLAVGLPVLVVLLARFLWDRNLNIGRSKEFEKLIWQLHRIASALEHQMNLSFPAVQPGTEEPRDLAYLKQIAAQPAVAAPSAASANVASPSVATPSVANAGAAAAAATASAVQQPSVQQPVTPAPAAQQPALPALELREPSEVAPRAGVNSMFGL